MPLYLSTSAQRRTLGCGPPLPPRWAAASSKRHRAVAAPPDSARRRRRAQGRDRRGVGGVATTAQHKDRAEVQATLAATGWRYYCDTCGLGFDSRKNWAAHTAGRKHAAAEAGRAGAWGDFAAAAPRWADEAAGAAAAEARWSGAVDLPAFPMRATCLHPGPTVPALPPRLRARFYAYLRDSFGRHFPELPAIFHAVDAAGEGRYLRVKELFETLEAFKVVSDMVVAAEQGQPRRRIDTIWDLACGHGLLGIMLAYRFPRKRVVCVDLEARPAFRAYRAAWEVAGDKLPGWRAPLQNLEGFREADLREAFGHSDGAMTANAHDTATVVGPDDCVVALHACNEANRDVVVGAQRAGAMWAVMPCCIRTSTYLQDCGLEQLPDVSRYLMLAGAFAGRYGAQMVRSIDASITARPVLIAGGMLPGEERGGVAPAVPDLIRFPDHPGRSAGSARSSTPKDKQRQ